MVKFAFHFLLGIPNVQPPDEEPPGFGDGRTDEENNYTEFKVDKPTFVCRLEYVLAPGEQPKSVDVICWGNAAKIYVEDDYVALIPLTLEKICWIYFRVKHVMTINNETVNDYYNHNVIVTANFERRKFENVKSFYGRRFDGRMTELFPRLWDRPEDISWDHGKKLDSAIERCRLSYKLQTIICELTKEINDENSVKKPSPLQMENPPWKNLKDEAFKTGFKKQDREPSDVPNNKNGRKEIVSKNKSNLSFIISGEDILSGLKIFENYVKYRSEELPFLYCVTKVTDVLNLDQAKYFNPLSITLKHLKFVPKLDLQRHNMRSIRFRYVVWKGYETESNDFEIDENLFLNYTRTIFTDRISTPELVEFIQTKGLKIMVIGIREDETEKTTPELFKDQRINCKSGLPGMERKKPKIPNAVVIGIADIDISSLIFEPREISLQCTFGCFSALPQYPPPPAKAEFTTTANPTEVNTYYGLTMDTSHNILAASQAVLNISVRHCYPVMEMLGCARPFFGTRNRIFLILHDLPLTINIIKKVQLNNGVLFPTDYANSATRINRPLSQYNEIPNPNAEFMLTGFLIDCVDNYLIYIEGPSIGIMQEIWSIASFVDLTKGRVLYDSSLVFNGLYDEDLIRYGGLYTVCLQQSPTVLLSDKNTYRKGNIPMPAFKALIKINQLLQCTSITTAIRNDLFPDYHSLLSLDLEFGVPLRFKATSY